MLPGIDGFRVCRIIREENRDIGIIILTAKGQDMDKIMGLLNILLMIFLTKYYYDNTEDLLRSRINVSLSIYEKYFYNSNLNEIINDDVNKIITNVILRFSLISIIAFVIGILLSILLADKIIKPIKYLTKVAKEMVNGELKILSEEGVGTEVYVILNKTKEDKK